MPSPRRGIATAATAFALVAASFTIGAGPAAAGDIFGWDPRKQVCSWAPALCRGR